MSALAPPRRDTFLLVAAAAGLALVTVAGVRLVGPAALALPLVVVAGVLALSRPAWVALAVLVATVTFEAGPGGLTGGGEALFDPIGGMVSPVEAIVGLLLVVVLLSNHARGAAVRLPTPFTAPLLIIAAGVAIGVLVGLDAGNGVRDVLPYVRTYGLLVVLPSLFAAVLDSTRALHAAIGVGVGLALFKALAGLAGIATGRGLAALEGTQITYYEPAANMLMLFALLLGLAATLQRAPLARWARWAAPLCFLALVLSYRRSFWIGGVLAIGLLVVLSTGPTARRLLVPAVAMMVVAGWLALSGGVVDEFQGPVAERAESLTNLEQTREDRYRLDERRNVLADIRESPITGIGLSVDWRGRYPLSVEHRGGRDFVHVTALHYWLKLGVAGLVGYVWLIIAAVICGLRIFSGHPDPLLRIAGVAIALGIVGLAVVELTASFTGVDARLTIVLAAALGFLAAARRGLPGEGRLT